MIYFIGSVWWILGVRMVRLAFLLVVICASTLLTACQTTTNVGEGEIYFFNDRFVSNYRGYRDAMKQYSDHSFAFVYDDKLKKIGWSGKGRNAGVSAVVQHAVELCRGGNPSANCRIFDIDGRIVWKRLNPDRVKELLATATKEIDVSNEKIVDFKLNLMSLGSMQKRRYQTYLKGHASSDQSSFFVSANGHSVGISLITGGGGHGYTTAINAALKNCKANSEFSNCYLFAVNGEPVNQDARQALK